MSTLNLSAFDSLKFANRLKAAGLAAQQAEAEAEVLREAFDERDRAFTMLENRVSTQSMLSEKEAGQMATKADVHALKADVHALKADMQAMKADMQADVLKVDAKVELLRKEIAISRRDTIIWLGGALAIGFGLVLRQLSKLPL